MLCKKFRASHLSYLQPPSVIVFIDGHLLHNDSVISLDLYLRLIIKVVLNVVSDNDGSGHKLASKI